MHDDLIICRCEDATLAELVDALETDERNVTQIKHRTRAGMGMCGGRTCRPVLERLLAERPSAVAFTHRLPARPLTVGEIAATPLAEDDDSTPSTPGGTTDDH